MLDDLYAKFQKYFWLSGLMIIAVLGFLKYIHQSWQLPANYIAKTLNITGMVISIPKQFSHGVSFQFAMTEFNGRKQKALLALSWYNDPPIIKVGQQWQLQVRLKPPHGFHNPPLFDYATWLKRQGISATGYVVAHQPQKLIHYHPSSYPILYVREFIAKRISASVSSPALAGVLIALSVGSRAYLDSNSWQVFQNTGTSHLIAISGLHVGLVALIVFALVSRIWRTSARLLLWVPAQRMGALIALIVVIAYGFLSGMSYPTERAVIMIGMVLLAKWLYQYVVVWQCLVLAFIVILALQPLAITSASFWLSFAAVGFLLYGMQGDWKYSGKIRQWLRLQWVMALGLLPVTLFFFYKISLILTVANAIAIPWVSFIIVPGCLFGSIACLLQLNALSVWIFKLTALCLQPLWWYLQTLAALPHVIWYHSYLSWWVFMISTVGVVLILAPKSIPFRYLGFLGLLPLAFYRLPSPSYGEIWLTLLDVGQGLSVLVQTQRHLLIFDAGPKWYNGSDAGAKVIVPYLRAMDLDRIDTLMISHGDNDHIGGAQSILINLPVSKILTSLPQRFANYSAKACEQGQQWQWDGVIFRVLSPPAGQPYSVNNSSCVVRVSNGKHSVLLTGDIEKEAEKWLLQSKQILQSDVIVVPHHGSYTSSTFPFITAVKPSFALIGVGAYNRFHFPKPAIVKRYQATGAKVMTTAQSGVIHCVLSKNRKHDKQDMSVGECSAR